MGKGSNVQKAQAARERNQKKMGKTDEERKAAKAKADADAAAFCCMLCKQTFMVNAKPPVLYLHVTSKHPAGTDPVACFASLKGFDPNDPNAPRAKPTWEMDENMRKLRRYENTGLGVVGDEYGRG